MTYRVTAIVNNPEGGTRRVSTLFAGCADGDDATRKARAIYDIVKITKVEPIPPVPTHGSGRKP